MSRASAETINLVRQCAVKCLERVDTLTDEQALTLAHEAAILVYQREIKDIKFYQKELRNLVNKIRFKDAVVRGLSKRYSDFTNRIITCERNIEYLELVDYTYKATKDWNLRNKDND